MLRYCGSLIVYSHCLIISVAKICVHESNFFMLFILSLQYYRKLDILEEGIKGMKPVNMRISNPGITVADLLDRKSPILHSLQGDTPPLPPIVPHPQNQAKQMS